jgi:urease accessory protein
MKTITDIVTHMADPQHSVSLARLLQLVSPALPVGAYAYSAGLEYAVDAGWVNDQASTQQWISGVIEHSVCHLDLPVLSRLYQAWLQNNAEQVHEWSRFLAASRESAELLAEDRHLGVALARLLRDLDIAQAELWIDTPEVSWATMFSLAASQWIIDESAMQQGYLWAWCENQVAAAIKLGPLGQTAGQQILSDCAKRLLHWVEESRDISDEAIGQFAPALAIGSALHEQQYSRLFRS